MTNKEQRTQTLREKYDADEYGKWEIFGEDPNCDFGGYHHEPSLGIFEGKYSDIVDFAVEMKGFWGWGAGGSIKKIVVTQIDSNTRQKQQELKERREQLEKQKTKIEEELQQLKRQIK